MTIYSEPLDEAVRPALEAVVPGFILGYQLSVMYVDAEGVENFVFAAPGNQRTTLTMELINISGEVGNILLARHVENLVDDGDRDE